MESNNYDIIIIGGGITGVGTARDCARRGLSVLLLERADLAHGTTGRNHGLLHSGARYAVTDPESARECVAENAILRRIAAHCIEPTDGLFVSLPEDGLDYQQVFTDACRTAGITTETLDPKQTLAMEPAVNPALTGAVRVPDATIDPFRLTAANMVDARRYGAKILTYHEVTGLLMSGRCVEGVRARDTLTGAARDYHASVVINAAGAWTAQVAQMAGIGLRMFPAKGAMLIYAERHNHMVLNRCRRPANGDILVPDGKVSILGTTSVRIDMDKIDDMRVGRDEVRSLIEQGVRLVPALATTRHVRAFAGVRPLPASDDDPSGRGISRGIVCLDHELRDDVSGLLTIAGGKLMTYRLMAERVTDLACEKLGKPAQCDTATAALPGSDDDETPEQKTHYPSVLNAAQRRHGSLTRHIPTDSDDRAIICECEGVTVGEVRYAVEHLQVRTLHDLRRRTRLGMGACQGRQCAYRAANLLARLTGDSGAAQRQLQALIDERWRGMHPVAWGNTLREALMTANIYYGLCGLEPPEAGKEEQP